MNSQTVTVNLVPGLSTPAVVRVSQYDYGRPILFKVMDGTMPASFVSGTVATVVGTKPSGLGFSEVAVISGNTASLDSTLAMTQECGMIPAEIRFSIQNGPDIGTANFILAVEPSPHPDGTTDGTQATMADLETRLQGEIDDLSDRIDDIEAGGSGLSQAEKNLILTLFSKAAYAESDAETAYDALEALWTSSTKTITYTLSHVTSSNTATSIESGQSYTTTLTASTDYTLDTVTVTMGGVDITSSVYTSGTVSIPSVTGNIVITATAVLAAQSITATYTQSGTVYDTDSLDSLKADLVVTANYAGGTSETVSASDYTLSGTLMVGTSTMTVGYAGLTTTFNVTVSQDARYVFYDYIYNIGAYKSNSDYVDTGLTFNPAFTVLDIEFEVMNSNTETSSDAIMGNWRTGTSDPATLTVYARANKAGVSMFALGVATQLPDLAGDTRHVVNYTFVNNGQSTLSSGQYSANVAIVDKSTIQQNTTSLILAGARAATTGEAYGCFGRQRTKIGYIKFTDPNTDTLVFSFIPAKNTETNKYGFYEQVNHVFYPQNGEYLSCGNWS